MKVQRFVADDGTPMVAMPEEAFEAMRDAAEFDAAMALKTPKEALIPGDVVSAMLDGDGLKAIRTWKGRTQEAVAGALGISQSYYAQIENGDRKLTLDIAKALAKLYDVDLELVAAD